MTHIDDKNALASADDHLNLPESHINEIPNPKSNDLVSGYAICIGKYKAVKLWLLGSSNLKTPEFNKLLPPGIVAAKLRGVEKVLKAQFGGKKPPPKEPEFEDGFEFFE